MIRKIRTPQKFGFPLTPDGEMKSAQTLNAALHLAFSTLMPKEMVTASCRLMPPFFRIAEDVLLLLVLNVRKASIFRLFEFGALPLVASSWQFLLL